MTSATPSPLVTFDNLSKRFGYRQVLRKINCQLFPSSIIFLLGKNGAGKSTLMKMLSGLSKPTEGSVLFQQKDIFDDISAYHEHIIYISHQNKIYSDLTLIENLKLLNNLHPNRRSLADIMEISSEVNLDGYRDLPTKWFSSGMSRRAGLARIMLTKPKLLILDEPYTGLDHKSILWFQSYLAAYRSQGGCVLITSHQIELALQLSDRVILLDQGKIKQDLPSNSVQMSDCYTWLEE